MSEPIAPESAPVGPLGPEAATVLTQALRGFAERHRAQLVDVTDGAEEVRVTSSTGGQKGSKLARFDLIPPKQLWRLAEHFGKGAEKYDDDNWRKGYPWKLSIAALERHLTAFKMGEDIDAETGSLHIIAAAWHAIILAEFTDIHPEFDTRLKTVDQRAVRG